MSFSPTHAGTLERDARDAVEDEESPNSYEDDTSSESNDSDDSSNDSLTYVEESFEVMFVPTSNYCRYEGINRRRLFSSGRGG